MRAPRLLLLDNFDSFSFMLADYLRVAGAEVVVERNDALSVEQALAGRDAIVISPGPGRPEAAGISIGLAAACIERRMPLLGICLGHQALAVACGGQVKRTAPVHGKIEPVAHDRSGLFAGLPSPFDATRYHSLAVTHLPAALAANAWSADGVVMAMRHANGLAHGIQFHPESVATAHGATLIAAFVEQCRQGA
jgi:anthranilate synthase component 2